MLLSRSALSLGFRKQVPRLFRKVSMISDFESKDLKPASPQALSGVTLPSEDEFVVNGHKKCYRDLPDPENECWVKQLGLQYLKEYSPNGNPAPCKILVLYGSLRARSFSKLLSYEFARILDSVGADVRVFDPEGLPIKDEKSDNHPKVLELRELCMWSEGHVWVSPEQHGTITGVFKNQIDWIPLNTGSVRPSQGRSLCVAQVNGGSQSFNSVNSLRILGRWMRMNVVTNQSSVPKAWTEFTEAGRMKESGLRDRVVDVAEEMFKWTMLMRDQSDFLVDRYSERKERGEFGKLLTQAEKEALNKGKTTA